MDRRRPNRSILTIAAVVASLLAVGCGSDDAPSATAADTVTFTEADSVPPADAPAVETLPTAVQTLTMTGTEYAFEIAEADQELHAGWTKVTFENRGVEAHQVMFASVRDGVDLAELAKVAGDDSSGSKAIEYVDMLGGVSYIGPGQRIEAMVQLPEGVVLAMCYVPDPRGTAHALSGMQTTLSVGAAAEPDADTGPPEDVVGVITMGPGGYDMPMPLPAGWYRVDNDDAGDAPGEGLHEMSILGLDRPLGDDDLDRLLDDLATNATPDVELDALGGLGALSAGFEGYVHLDLEPGPYLAVDFMPDPGDPRPHLLDSYVTGFDV